jgi:hypothetical protein
MKKKTKLKYHKNNCRYSNFHLFSKKFILLFLFEKNNININNNNNNNNNYNNYNINNNVILFV